MQMRRHDDECIQAKLFVLLAISQTIRNNLTGFLGDEYW